MINMPSASTWLVALLAASVSLLGSCVIGVFEIKYKTGTNYQRWHDESNGCIVELVRGTCAFYGGRTCSRSGFDTPIADCPPAPGVYRMPVICPDAKSGAFGVDAILGIGWPVPVFRGAECSPNCRVRASTVITTRLLGKTPTQVYPRGLLIDLAAYFGVYMFASVAFNTVRKRVRARRGLCQQCGYPIRRTDYDEVCPECGAGHRTGPKP